MPRKNLEILRELVRAQGRLVLREELIRAVWPDTVVEEATVRQTIYTLRSTLRDIDSTREYVETAPKLGYRLAVPVETLNGIQTSTAPAVLPRPPLARLRPVLALPACGILLAGYAAWAKFSAVRSQSPTSANICRNAWELLDSRRPEYFPAAAVLFDDALKLNPHLAMAHGGKAILYVLEAQESLAESEALKAQQDEPLIGFPYAVRGFNRMMYHWDWNAAGESMRKLDQLGCYEPVCRQWLALYQALTGDMVSAIRSADGAVELNPARLSARAQQAQILYWAGRNDDAIQVSQTVIAAGGVSTHARYHLWKAFLARGNRRAAADTVMLALEPSWYRLSAADAFHQLQSDVVLRDRPEFWTRLFELEQSLKAGHYLLAEFAMAAGDQDRALSQLEICLGKHEFFLPFAKRDPLFAPLHGNPRYEAVMRGVGL